MGLIGTHISIAGGFDKAIYRGEQLQCEAIQFFSKNQLQWRSSPPTVGQISSFMKAWSESSIVEVLVHASYLINLAASGSLNVKSTRALIDEIYRCQNLGISTLVLHPGSHTDCSLDEGLQRVAVNLARVLEQTEGTDVMIALETMAGQGNSLGFRLEHLGYIMSFLDWDDRLKICLDTAHLFAAGYELRTKESYDRFMKLLDRDFGYYRIACWHFNDSKREKGSRVDRHENLGEGQIGLGIFEMILSDDTWNHIPCVLETPKTGPGDAANLAILRKLRGS